MLVLTSASLDTCIFIRRIFPSVHKSFLLSWKMKVQVTVQNNHQYQQTKMYSHKSKFSASIRFLLNKISGQTEKKFMILPLVKKNICSVYLENLRTNKTREVQVPRHPKVLKDLVWAHWELSICISSHEFSLSAMLSNAQ